MHESSKVIYKNYLFTPQGLHPYLVVDAIKLEPVFMLAALHRGQMRPQLGVLLSCPLLHLVLPILIWNGIVE